MKVAYKHLIQFIPSKPNINDISDKLFHLGHEHEISEGIFDIELTPNRGDCLSIKGLLRDLAVFYNVKFNSKIYTDDIKPLKIDFINKAPEACPHISFCKINIEGNIKPYQGLFKEYFDDLEISRNNFFTDISNYISYETGQPTHCYDAEKFKDSFSLEIIKGEYEFETLMSKKVKLSGENLLFIKDDNTILNLAGIMGGMGTTCSKDTKSVIIECAYFNPQIIIGKSVKYDIHSDAAYKFERGTDPLCHDYVLRRFINIVEAHSTIKDIELFRKDYSEYNSPKILFNETKLNKILGTSINKKELEDYIIKLGFKIIDDFIIPPSCRGDVNTENDIAEELARVIGYNNIPSQPIKIPRQITTDKDSSSIEQVIKNLLIKNGFFEVINNPFVDSEMANSIKVDNPLDSNRKFMRTNLQSSLIDNLLYNERRQQDSVKLFELADVYYSSEGIKNKRKLGIICSGRVGRNYVDFSKNIDINYLINIFKSLSTKINISPVLISRDKLDSKLKSQIIYIELELDYFKKYNLDEEYDTSKKLTSNNFTKYKPISNYPSSSRDISFSIKDINRYLELQGYILNFKNNLIKEIFVFDFFVNKKNNEIKLGVRFIFQSKNSTITETEINNLMNIIIETCTAIDSVSVPGLSQ